jgi:hypothetical protein
LGSYFLQRITTNLGTDFDGLAPKTGRLVDGDALAATKPIYYFVQNRHDRVGNLISRRGGVCNRASASALSDSAQFPFDGAELAGDGADVRVKFSRAILKHPFSPAQNLLFASDYTVLSGLGCRFWLM